MKKLLAFFAVFGAVAHGANVVDLRVKALDGFGGDTSSVLTRCQTQEGGVYDPVTVSRDVTALKATREFQEISADAHQVEGGYEVVFYVKRKMRFQAPAVVKGCAFFSESKVVKESGLKDGELYGEGDFAEAAAKVRLAYQKKHYPDAKVTPVTEVIPGGNSCTVTLIVDEGERLTADEFVFDGTDADEAPELCKAIGVYPWWNPVGWFGERPASREQLAQTVAKLKEHYADLGYLDVKVGEPVREAKGEGLAKVVYAIEKGPRYTVGSTRIEGLTRYPEAVVAEKSDLPAPGSVAGAKALADAAHRIAVTVGSGDSGLADTRVDVRRLPAEDSDTKLDVVFKVTEGVPVVINEVRIEGNDYTKDKVIRREIDLGPGDRMLEDRAERSQRRLQNLDYFSRVRYYLKDAGRGRDQTGAEYRDLVYEVEEKGTGSFMVGVGASSVDSVYVSAEVSQSNFDLFAPEKLFRGGGQKARLYAQCGPRIQSYEAAITEPWLFDRMLELTVEGYRRLRWYDEYDIVRTGGALTLAYPVKVWNPARLWNPDADGFVKFGRFGIRWTGEFIAFDDVEHGEWEYKGREVSFDEEDRLYGDAFESVIRVFWSRDTRDSYRLATSGTRSQLFFDITAGGDNQYYRLGFSHRNYFPVWRRYNHVLMVALRGETIEGLSDDVPIYNRLFLGGPKSVRGIEYRNVSPFARHERESGSYRYTPWGGQTLLCMNVEYTVPVVKMLRLAAFTDLGSVGADEFDFDFSDTFAWTAGFGVRFDIPSFPIRLDFGFPIEKPDHCDKELFSFTVGYDF